MTLPWNTAKKTDPGSGPADSMTLRAGRMEKAPLDPSDPIVIELESAKKLFQDAKYPEAEKAFHKICKNTKNPIPVAEEALYYEAESQRLAGNYRTAEGTFKKLLKEFRYGQYTDKANKRLFDIANYWLDETRAQMAAYEEKREGKRWLVMPASFVHFSQDKPFLDSEGHAMAALEEVRINDINGPLGERALFYLATVKFFREDYKESDYYYTQLYQSYPNSSLAPKAIKQAIICKQIMNGGSVYDTRSLVEAQKLAHVALTAYPQFANNEKQWVNEQLISINLQQADRDWNIAEFYRRTGHPGSAYFYYELVKRRYPNTPYDKKAQDRMAELQGKVEAEKGKAPRETNPMLNVTSWLPWSTKPKEEEKFKVPEPTPAMPTPTPAMLPPSLDAPPRP